MCIRDRVSADVIGIRARVEDVANGQLADPPNRGKHAVRRLARSGIHDHQPDWTLLDDDVRTCTSDHVDAWADPDRLQLCLLYTSDAADERSSVDLGGRRIIKK